MYNHYKIHVAQKRIYFDMVVTKQVLPILHLFCKLNIVRRFFFFKDSGALEKKVRVFPFYSRLQAHGAQLRLHFHKTHPVTIQLKALKLLTKRTGHSSLILNTSKGLITHHEALKLGVGGVLVYTLN